MNLESIVKKLFLGGTLAVAVAVSMMAASSFAVSAEGTVAANGVSSQTTFSLTVDKVLTLSSASAGEITALPNDIATGSLAVNVQTNSKYTISLSAATPELRLGGTDTINTIPASSSVTAKQNGWGIKKDGEATYTALTPSGEVFYTSTAAAPTITATDFEIGVGTAPTLPDGTYSTTVTVTAAVQP